MREISPIESQRDSAKLSDSLGDWIRHRKKLIGVLVEEQMVIAEMWTAHVPVEIFRLHVKREHIGENGIHRAAYVFDGRSATDPFASRAVRRVSRPAPVFFSN